VRCLFEVDAGPPAIYEERITLWRADGFDDAIALAEAEAREYSLAVDGRYLDLAQCYALPDEPQHGAEVFSLMRESTLDRQTYLAQFFDTGSEHQEKS
jgi:hypothetical protein